MMGMNRWFITVGFQGNHRDRPRYTAYVVEEHPAEYIQDCLQYDDGNYWIAYAVPYFGDLPTGELEALEQKDETN